MRYLWLTEEFEDIKGVIIFRKLKKNRQYNNQKKKDKRTNKDQQNIHIKLRTGLKGFHMLSLVDNYQHLFKWHEHFIK
jgi:hypothetical protein